mgnify:CR=1 FL=1
MAARSVELPAVVVEVVLILLWISIPPAFAQTVCQLSMCPCSNSSTVVAGLVIEEALKASLYLVVANSALSDDSNEVLNKC